MVTFWQISTSEQVMPTSGECFQNVGLNRSRVLGMFPHPKVLPYKEKPIKFFVM